MTVLAVPALAEDPSRYRTRHARDGDFTVEEILTAARGHRQPQPVARERPGLAVLALRERWWRPDGDTQAPARNLSGAKPPGDAAAARAPSPTDQALLHRFETSGLWQPPVTANLTVLTPRLAARWLALATHWIVVAQTTADQRFFNTACKLLGGVWTWWYHERHTTGPGPERTAIMRRLRGTARLIDTATDRLVTDLRHRLTLPVPDSQPPAGAPAWATSIAADPPPTIAVLAAGGSGTARALLAAQPTPPISLVCWYDPPTRRRTGPSGYADAWYPETHHRPAPAPAATHPNQVHARDWDTVAETLRQHHVDLVVLAGMPIVPEPILRIPRLATINAHNGALPAYRGMDAVAWAVINNDPIVCTLHQATPAVDQGDIWVAQPVPYQPAATLRSRVKHTQILLLAAATWHVAAADRLPSTTSQGTGRQFYRLHPHLKRALDAATKPAVTSPKGIQPS